MPQRAKFLVSLQARFPFPGDFFENGLCTDKHQSACESREDDVQRLVETLKDEEEGVPVADRMRGERKVCGY